jgi:hypothetical protein
MVSAVVGNESEVSPFMSCSLLEFRNEKHNTYFFTPFSTYNSLLGPRRPYDYAPHEVLD